MKFSRLGFDDLNPVVAVYPLRLVDGVPPDTAIDRLKERLTQLIGTSAKSGQAKPEVREIEILKPSPAAPWKLIGAVYRLEQAPSWMLRLPEDASDEERKLADDYRQSNWHLALVGIARPPGTQGWVFVHATQDTIGAVIREWLVAGRFGENRLNKVVAEPFDDGVLRTVCLEGVARQTALKGVHRSVASKPDSKSLLGLDLKEALDPFADQTYRLTSAVSRKDGRTPQVLGLSIQAERLWSSRTKEFADLVKVLNAIFEDLQSVQNGQASSRLGLGQKGFKDLARPEPPTAIIDARAAFDAVFRPTTDLTIFDEQTEAAEGGQLKEQELRWFADGDVRLLRSEDASANFSLRISKAGRHLLDLEVKPVPADGAVSLALDTVYAAPEDDPAVELFETLAAGNGLGDRLAVWYDSGHALVEGQVSTIQYQDVLFEGWAWQDISAFDVEKEKPMKPSAKDPKRQVADLDSIGKSDSLFCFSLNKLPVLVLAAGPLWAFCDDGAGEAADFIFFDPAGRKLWLVHAKGADSGAVGRKISVSAYEQVVSQARKNLRFLDPALLAEEIAKRGEGLPRIWKDGAPVPPGQHKTQRKALCDALSNVIFFEDKRLVVLQPHVRKDSWDGARGQLASGGSGPDVKSYRLLSALLADLQMTAQKVGAKLMVIGAEPSPVAAQAPQAARAPRRGARAAP